MKMDKVRASSQWQLNRKTAARYEQIIVPVVLLPAATMLIEWSRLREGETIVDIGCGTGAVTRLAAPKVGVAGRVIGIDVNSAMLEIAKSLSSISGAEIAWYENSAYEVDLPENSADVVLCAQTLQFLENRPWALSEMSRILMPGGRLCMSLWCSVEDNPYFQALVDAISTHVNPETAVSFYAASSLSESSDVYALLKTAGFIDIEVLEKEFILKMPELRQFLPRHISATPMAIGYGAASVRQQKAVIEHVITLLSRYQTEGGAEIPFKMLLTSASAVKEG